MGTDSNTPRVSTSAEFRDKRPRPGTPWCARTSLLALCLHPLQCLELVLNMVEQDRVWEPSESEASKWYVPRRTSGPVQERLGRRDSGCAGSRATGLVEPQGVQSHFSGELRS